MRSLTRTRSRWWLIGIAVTIAFAVKTYTHGVKRAEPPVVSVATTVYRADPPSRPNPDAPPRFAAGHLTRSHFAADTGGLFRPKSWYVAPPPAPAPPPPVPTVPPLPFTFLGKVREPDGQVTIFLSDQDHVYLIHGGETLRGTYHVERIAHDKLTLTYLPLRKKQYLNLTGAP